MNLDKSQKYVSSGLFALIIVLCSCCFVNILIGNQTNVNVALACLTVSTLYPTYRRARGSNFNLFEPVYAYIIIFSVFYLFSSIYIYNREELYATSMRVDIYDESTNLPVIYVLSVSMLLFHLGYSFATKKQLFDITSLEMNLPKSRKLGNMVSILYFISIAFRFYGYSVGKMGSLTTTGGFNFPGASLVYFVTNIWYMYFAYFAIKYLKENKGKRVFYFLLLFETLIVLISGDRRYIIQIVLILLSVFYYVHKTIPWKLCGILAAVFVFVYLPVTTFYGYYLTAGMSSSSEYLNLISFTFTSLSTMQFDDLVSDFILNPIAESLFVLPTLILPYSTYDLHGIHWGPIGIMNLLNNIIPSGFIGRFDTRQYYELYASDALSYSVEYSPLTFQFGNEVILSFGLFWLPMSFFILGFLIGLVYKRLFFRDDTSKWIYIGLFFGITYSTNFGLLTTELLTPIRILLYFLIIDYFFNRRPGIIGK